MDRPSVHTFNAGNTQGALIVEGSQVYEISSQVRKALDFATASGDKHLLDQVFGRLGFPTENQMLDHVPTKVPVRSFSLAVAQKCNLGCTYCYAQGGEFGGKARNMPIETVLQSVDKLFEGVPSGEHINLAFMGGEPLVNRQAVYDATLHANSLAEAKNVSVGFSITTNGTLLTLNDAKFFEKFGFSVTISLDGPGEKNDKLRPYKNGRGSYDRVVRNIKPLLAMQDDMQVSARVTVTPKNMNLLETLNEFVDLGFYSVGFSPMVSSPTGTEQLTKGDFEAVLENLIECANTFEKKLSTKEKYPFSNVISALHEIHKGSHKPYPCGAGAGYFGVSAEGKLYSCHRFVDDDAGFMGDIRDGVVPNRQKQWLQNRHVHNQEPCQSCWAKYLCGGGCHHEVINRGRPACDFIRGWLDYCLGLYVRTSKLYPEFYGIH